MPYVSLLLFNELNILCVREVASLNEFRQFFGLEPHTTFAQVNPDPKIQKALENLYDSPDMIEMYPGIFVEESPKDPNRKAFGVGFPGTAGRGVLSDAVTLVRSDRFYTTDYTTATLTNWGMCEAASDYKTLGGSMFHKLLRRGLPGHFDFNSVYAMQPMYTSKANAEIFTRLKTFGQYTVNGPSVPQAVAKIDSYSDVSQAIGDRQSFESAWSSSTSDVTTQKALVALNEFEGDLSIALSQQISKEMSCVDYLTQKATDFVKRNSFRLGKNYYQIDLVRE